MTDIAEAYQARHDGATAGGQLIADDMAAMPDEIYAQAYSDAYLAKYQVRLPKVPATSKASLLSPTSTPSTDPGVDAEVVVTAKRGPEDKAGDLKPPDALASAGDAAVRSIWDSGRLAASAGEGVTRAVWELGRTVRDIGDFITRNSPLTTESDMMMGAASDQMTPSGARIADYGPMPDMVPNKSGIESFTSGTAQFMAPFAEFSKAMAGAKLFDAVGRSKAAGMLLKVWEA